MTDREGVDMADAKRCTRCGEMKSLGEFSPNKTGRYGRQPFCKPCAAEYLRAYRAADREASREYERAYRAANRDKRSAQRAALRAANLEREREIERARRAANPYAQVARNARARGAKVVEMFTLDELVAYLIEHGMDPDRCVYCEGPREQWDHAHAISLGGSHTIDNVVPACGACNKRKGRAERTEVERRRGLAS